MSYLIIATTLGNTSNVSMMEPASELVQLD